MAWSIKLQSGTGGVQGYNEFELVYNATTQTSYKSLYGFALGNEGPDVLYHTPDNGSPIPVRANGTNRLMFLEMHIPPQTSWDTVLNKIAPIARLIDGPDSQAVRAQTAGDVDKVRLAIKPDGATFTTYYEILDGKIDRDSYSHPVSVNNTMLYQVRMYVTCKPFGYGDAFDLKNYLASSPHMIEDSDSNGLADGWSAYGTPTETVISNLSLTGGYSQKVTADSGSGVATNVVTASTSTDLVDFVWVYSSAMSGFQMSLRDGSNNAIQSVTCTAANADKTAVDDGGRTWYRFKAAGQNTTAANARLTVTSTSAGKVFYVDMGYLQTGTQTAPPAFSSKRNLYNRYDPAIATTNINYLDVWGIPGDAPALLKMTMQPTAGKATQYIVGAYADGKSRANEVTHYHDSSEYTSLSGTWANGTGTINNNYKECSTTGGVLAVSGSSEVQKISNIYARQPWRVFVLAYTSDVTATIQMKYYSGSSTVAGVFVAQTAVGSLTETSKWQLVDLGTLNLVDVLSEDVDFNLSEEIHITQASSQTLRIDGVFYMPTQNGFNISKHYDLASAAYKGIIYDGHTDQTYDAAEGIRLTSIGRLPTLTPGPVMNRLVFIVLDGADTELDITSVFPVDLEVTPRTSHLLGVA